MKTIFYLTIFSLFFALSCGKEKKNKDDVALFPLSTANKYFKTSQKVIVEVYYEPGAEPFTGNNPFGKPYWGLLEDNLTAIFQYRTSPPQLTVPKLQSEMHALPLQNKTQWTPEQILALNTTYKQGSPTDTEARFYIYFLNGTLSGNSGVIGASLNGTPILAVFKSVVAGSGGPIVQRYVEQSTIIHEMGHALGFVNSGVPMKTPHQDAAHGAHTNNSNCVMYWLNEGVNDLTQFIVHFITTGNTIMWGPEVLADAQNYSN
jgi:hypothetical protein